MSMNRLSMGAMSTGLAETLKSVDDDWDGKARISKIIEDVRTPHWKDDAGNEGGKKIEHYHLVRISHRDDTPENVLALVKEMHGKDDNNHVYVNGELFDRSRVWLIDKINEQKMKMDQEVEANALVRDLEMQES